MENISQSFETLKNIYLHQMQKDFVADLDGKLMQGDLLKGFDRVEYWKIFAEKFGFVMKNKSPELFEVFGVIVKEILEIMENGKKLLNEEFLREKKFIVEENEKFRKLLEKAESEVKAFRDEKEKEKEKEREREKEKLDKGDQNPDPKLVAGDWESEKLGLNQEMEGLRKEWEAEKKKNIELSLQIQELKAENQDLVFVNSELQISLDELKSKTLEPQIKTEKSFESEATQKQIPQLEDSKPKSSTQKITLNPKLLPINPPKKTLIKPRQPNSHDLTIRQLKETIEEIYQSKLKFDEKCQDSRQPRETMDQFLYTYLNQKYGLKPLIAEWSVLIRKAIDKNESSDAEILLFSKILNHRVDEGYKQVFETLKDNMKQFLKAKIQQRGQYMREIQLNSLLKEKIAGVLDEDEWATIIVSMFSQEEAEFMIGNFKSLLFENSGKLILARKSKNIVKKGDASYEELQNFILNYDLSAREALLTPFYQYFTIEDFDKNGILSSEEFKMLCYKLGLDNEYSRLICQIDPYNSNFVTFSDCVSLFTYEMVALEDQSSISVLHYLFFQSKSRI